MSSFTAINDVELTGAAVLSTALAGATSSDSSLAKLYQDYLPGRQPANLREAARVAAVVLKADEFTTFMSSLYEFVGEVGDKANEQAAWLSDFEAKQGH